MFAAAIETCEGHTFAGDAELMYHLIAEKTFQWKVYCIMLGDLAITKVKLQIEKDI